MIYIITLLPHVLNKFPDYSHVHGDIAQVPANTIDEQINWIWRINGETTLSSHYMVTCLLNIIAGPFL